MLSEGGTLVVPSQFHSAVQHSELIMTPWQKRTTSLTQRMADDMRVRNYSQRTIDAYTYHVGRFADFLSRSPESAAPEDVRSFHKGNAPDPMRATARNFESAHDVRSLTGLIWYLLT